MWSEEPDIAKVLFNTYKNILEYQFTQVMWSEKLDMIKILFDIQQIVERVTHDVINQKYGKDSFH